jgi:hypothetical protein
VISVLHYSHRKDGDEYYGDPPGTPIEMHVTDCIPDWSSCEEDDERFGPLEERLRELNWPQPPEGMRERSLEEFRRTLAERTDSGNGNGAAEADDAEELEGTR